MFNMEKNGLKSLATTLILFPSGYLYPPAGGLRELAALFRKEQRHCDTYNLTGSSVFSLFLHQVFIQCFTSVPFLMQSFKFVT